MKGGRRGGNPDHDREEVPGRLASPENMREQAKEGKEQRAEEGGGLRAVSRSIAVVAAGVLVGGGIGLLVGTALGVFNPFVLGVVGMAVGVGASGPLMSAVSAHEGARRSWGRRIFGGD